MTIDDGRFKMRASGFLFPSSIVNQGRMAMLSHGPGFIVCLLWIALGANAAEQAARERNFIAARTYSVEEDARILKLFEGLRVADVSDGMDIAGLQDIGLINPEIRPLWRDTESFEHQIRGIAVTVRYV